MDSPGSQGLLGGGVPPDPLYEDHPTGWCESRRRPNGPLPGGNWGEVQDGRPRPIGRGGLSDGLTGLVGQESAVGRDGGQLGAVVGLQIGEE